MNRDPPSLPTCAPCSHELCQRASLVAQGRIAQGLCGPCGKAEIYQGKTMCLACLESLRQRALANYRNEGRKPHGCSTCTAQGLTGINHNARTHDRYMRLAESWKR